MVSYLKIVSSDIIHIVLYYSQYGKSIFFLGITYIDYYDTYLTHYKTYFMFYYKLLVESIVWSLWMGRQRKLHFYYVGQTIYTIMWKWQSGNDEFSFRLTLLFFFFKFYDYKEKFVSILLYDFLYFVVLVEVNE